MPFMYYSGQRFKASHQACPDTLNIYNESLKVVANTASVFNTITYDLGSIMLMIKDGDWIGISNYLSSGDELCQYSAQVISENGGVVRHYDSVEKYSSKPQGWSLRVNLGSIDNPYNYVYVITDGDFLKVGISKNPEGRLKGLQTANARKLGIVQMSRGMSREDAVQWEAKLHAQHKEERVEGEWFSKIS